MSLRRIVGWSQHDAAKDVASVALAKSTLSAPVETLTMGLVPNAKGGALEPSWGAEKLAAPFEIAK